MQNNYLDCMSRTSAMNRRMLTFSEPGKPEMKPENGLNSTCSFIINNTKYFEKFFWFPVYENYILM